MATSWIDSEPGFFALRHELSRLLYRAGRRRRKVMAVALALTAAAVLFTLRVPRLTRAQITVRVTEVVDFRLPRSTWTDRELRSFVTQVAFTNEVLTHVYQTLLADFAPASTLALGIEQLREDVEVTAIRNRVMAEEQATSGPRSAYLILRFAARREDRALAVLTALAQPIMDSSARRRRLEAEQELARIALSLENAKAMAETIKNQALKRAATPMAGAGSISPVRMVSLEQALKEAHFRVARFEQEKDDAELRARAETRRSGIDFEIAEQSVERPLPRVALLLGVALLTFLFALPLSAIVIGAAATTVDSLDDIRRMGLEALGRLPALPDGGTP